MPFVPLILAGQVAGVANAARGSDAIGRITCASTIALLAQAGEPWYALPFHALAIFVGLLPGWGTYMRAAVDGVIPLEPEDRLIDWLLLPLENLYRKLTFSSLKKRLAYQWGMLGMSLRFLIYFSPLIAWHGLAAAILLALVGPYYWLAGRSTWGNPDSRVRLAEWCAGLMLLGACYG